MNAKRTLCVAIGLASAPAALPALAQQSPADGAQASPATGLTELTDEEMGDMRGRYTVGDNKVAWFGVTMVSTWQTDAGEKLQSRMTVGIDLTQPTMPKVVFQPHVSITGVDEAMPAAATAAVSGKREIDNAGLANVNGMVQSVQVAGDGNRASNTASISVHGSASAEGGTAAASAAMEAAAPMVAVASAPGVNAVASLQNNAARVLLQIDGRGAVEQWISSSGLGQTIQLAADGHQASNWMELDVVRQSSPGSRGPVGQNVAQAIALSRGIAIRY